jgi:hypothetical protein
MMQQVSWLRIPAGKLLKWGVDKYYLEAYSFALKLRFYVSSDEFTCLIKFFCKSI